MSNSTMSGQKPARRSIVVAGGSSKNTLSVSLLLQRFGYGVFEASSGVQALHYISEKRPSLVISEVTLPDMSGMDFFQNFGKITGASAIPVLFMVFPGDAAAEGRCLGYGAAGCIAKPVQVEELYQAVQKVIEPRPRASIRIDTRLPVSVNNLTTADYGDGSDIDLSEDGMYVPTSKTYPASRLVTVQFRMKERSISTDGRVLYNRNGKAGHEMTPGMGLKFTSIDSQDREFIRKFIREEITRDLNTNLLRTADQTR